MFARDPEGLGAAAETDTIIAKRFLRVAGFHDSPASLMLPSVVLRVAATNWRQARARNGQGGDRPSSTPQRPNRTQSNPPGGQSAAGRSNQSHAM